MKQSSVKIVILGGLGEFGCNMMAIDSGEDIVIIDAGLGFPSENISGVDIIVPDISYLKDNQKRLRAILITHGHEDHIGALPYFFRQIHVPIYAPAFAYHLIKQKIKGKSLIEGKKWLNEVIIGKLYQIGNIKVEFFPVNHSIPDSTGIILYTKAGIILHTGDFKRGKPLIGSNAVNWKTLHKKLPDRIRVLCSDSTYSIVPGNSESDQIVEPHLANIVKKTQAKIFFSTFELDEDPAPAEAALVKAAGFLRTRASEMLRIHRVPELRFHYDNSAKLGLKLIRLIEEVSPKQGPDVPPE